mgnify:CR=1 FL=1
MASAHTASRLWARVGTLGSALLAALFIALPATADDAPWVHAYAAFTSPKYPAGFSHFEYVNPAAPKGGTLHLGNPDRRSSFDKFNPFTVRGNAPAALSIFVFESLAVLSGDEPQTMYGLLAESMQVAPDFASVAFRLHPQARFTNGDVVTADDVAHSYRTLTSKFVSPVYTSVFGALGRAVVVDARTVRFELRDRNLDSAFLAGSLPVFSAKWGAGKRFDEVVTEHPIASGPYTVALADSGRRLELQRDPNYWARDLGVRRGSFNIDRIVYDYYRDDTVAFEAFKAGNLSLRREWDAGKWAGGYNFPAARDGRVAMDELPHGRPEKVRSFIFNTRRAPFDDIRVRQALNLLFDFDWMNKNIFHGQYKHINSYFPNSELAAPDAPPPPPNDPRTNMRKANEHSVMVKLA